MQKLRILIVDYTTHHPEVIDALCHMFGNHHVRLVVTSSFKTKFTGDFCFDDAAALIMPKKMAKQAWLTRLAPVMVQQDIVIFSTAVRSPLLLQTLKLPTKAKKIIFVHNTHYFTERFAVDRKNYSIIFGQSLTSPQAWLHYAQQRFKFAKRQLRQKIDGTGFESFAAQVDYFCFGNEHLARYFTELSGYDNAVTLPTCASITHLPRPSYHGVLRIGIIGTVSPDRKNYLEIIAVLASMQLNAAVELHLLGRCPDRLYAQQITTLIEQSSNPHFKVIFDPNGAFIPVAELQYRLQSIHLLLSPIHLDFSFHFYRERYGLTKLSGAEADCVRFDRPMLLPQAYRFSARIEALAVPYRDTNHLCEIINALQNDGKLHALFEKSAMTTAATALNEAAALFLQRIHRQD